jgi:hypothetical protein
VCDADHAAAILNEEFPVSVSVEVTVVHLRAVVEPRLGSSLCMGDLLCGVTNGGRRSVKRVDVLSEYFTTNLDGRSSTCDDRDGGLSQPLPIRRLSRAERLQCCQSRMSCSDNLQFGCRQIHAVNTEGGCGICVAGEAQYRPHVREALGR